ncbi:MAG: MFS transporter [Candidatus Hydrogenedentes bacterium]|nr:MFS transporter [Candidatus Hydrogenedentota bacterium]
MFTPLRRMYLVGFVLDFAIMAGITGTPFFLYDVLHGDERMSGYIGGLQMAAYAFACIAVSGIVSRVRNGLWYAMGGIAVFSLVYAPFPLTRSPIVCGALTVVAFGALAFVWPALHSWVGAEPNPAKRARQLGWFNVAWSFGFAVSPMLAGPLYDLDFRLPFLVLLLLGSVCFALLLSLPHERDLFGPGHDQVSEERAAHDRASEVYLYAAWFATFVVNVLVGVLRTVYPKRIQDLLGSGELCMAAGWPLPGFLHAAPATTYALLASALSLLTAAAFMLLGRSRCWRHDFRLVIWLQAGCAGAFWLLGRTSSLLLMAPCFAVVGAALGVAFFSSVYYSVTDAAHKHRRATINEAAVGMGGFAGSVVFGYVIGRSGNLALPFLCTPLFIAAALFLQRLLIAHGRRRVEASPAASAENDR